MSIKSGQKLGAYEVVELIGAGGMGEVYRAHDPKLKRDIAVKILPESLSHNAERLARFQREAEALAAINHPNIATIYELGEDPGVRFLAMELIEGDTLADRIDKRKIGLPEVLNLAKQIAEALEAAHERGIIHRDLKPANVKITPDGRVKVLDFGLAAIIGPGSAARDQDVSALATLNSEGATQPGVILGTAAYMSPEQARGKTVDKRTDIWAFGCLLYEMLGGERPFEGETVSDTIARILEREPDWGKLPSVPHRVLALLRRCLAKDLRSRIHDVADVRIELESLVDEPIEIARATEHSVSKDHRFILGLAAGLLIAITGGLTLRGFNRPDSPRSWTATVLRSSAIAWTPQVSPDGKSVAFLGLIDGQTQVGVLNPDTGNWTLLTNNRERGFVADLCWSPDASRIFFDRWEGTPRGIYSVPSLGNGEERLVLENAASPKALPDGSLVVERFNDQNNPQLFRYWPEKQEMVPLDAYLESPEGPPYDIGVGESLVFWGKVGGQPASDPQPHLYSLDLRSGRPRRLAPEYEFTDSLSRIAVDRSTGSVYATQRSGDLVEVLEIQAGGRVQPVLSLPVNQTWGLAAGPDGSLYIAATDRPVESVRFSASGGSVETLLTSASGYAVSASLLAPGGMRLIQGRVSGRPTLLAAQPEREPARFLDTQEETSGPLALVGEANVAFLLGSGAQQVIGVASIADGRLLRRLEGTRGRRIRSFDVSPDGSTIYFVSDNQVWSIPATGGEVRRIAAGNALTAHPNGRELIVLIVEPAGAKLMRVNIATGDAVPVPFEGDVRLNYQALGPRSVSNDDRLVLSVGSRDIWYWQAAVLDLKTGKTQRIPLNYIGDVTLLSWQADGRISATGIPVRNAIWRYRLKPDP